ncbi:MAG: hypothetical protein NTY80_03720 [candidate division SR1 bacterium]|nr:hypothetical protein [candidate division SR1 bacterium]
MSASGITINTSNISILYSGALSGTGHLPNLSNMKAYYYNYLGSLMSIQSCVYAGNIYTCPSSIGVSPLSAVEVKISASIPSFATGTAKLKIFSIVANSQSGIPQSVLGLPIYSPLIVIN